MVTKDFNKCIRDLYKQEESKTSILKHHTSDYLTRVEKIREEKNKSTNLQQHPEEKQHLEMGSKGLVRTLHVESGSDTLNSIDKFSTKKLMKK